MQFNCWLLAADARKRVPQPIISVLMIRIIRNTTGGRGLRVRKSELGQLLCSLTVHVQCLSGAFDLGLGTVYSTPTFVKTGDTFKMQIKL